MVKDEMYIILPKNSLPLKITQNQQNGGFSVSNGEITIARGDSKTPVRYFLGKRHVGNIYFSLRSIGDNRVNEWSRLYGITNVKITHLASGAGISYTLRGKCKRGMFIADVRLLVPEKGKYCIAEILQVKNQTCDVLQIAGMYVLPEPLFERIQNVEPFPFGVNSGRRVDAWCAADGTYLGAASSLGRFAISFWQSEKEGCKYDAYTPMNTTLKKGEVHKPELPAYLFVFSGKGAYNLHGKRIIEQDITTCFQMLVDIVKLSLDHFISMVTIHVTKTEFSSQLDLSAKNVISCFILFPK